MPKGYPSLTKNQKQEFIMNPSSQSQLLKNI